MEYNVGDIVQTKNSIHVEVNYGKLQEFGVDFKLKCLGCEHELILERPKALKMIVKKVEEKK